MGVTALLTGLHTKLSADGTLTGIVPAAKMSRGWPAADVDTPVLVYIPGRPVAEDETELATLRIECWVLTDSPDDADAALDRLRAILPLPGTGFTATGHRILSIAADVGEPVDTWDEDPNVYIGSQDFLVMYGDS